MQSFPGTDQEAYKALARSWAATVTAITMAMQHTSANPAREGMDPRGDGVAFDGLTATAFLTVSIEPPIILVCIGNNSSALAVLRESGAFAVNLLAEDQMDIAAGFARPQHERLSLWQSLTWTTDKNGSPILHGTAGAFSANVREFIHAGDHTLVLGDVTEIHHGETTETLLYHNRAYGSVERRA